MLFNSIEFALFLPIVLLVYWYVFKNSLKAQNVWIVFTSYIFYGWWDWRFLTLVAFSSLIDYVVGIKLGSTSSPSGRRLWLLTSILVNLGLLGFFKYYDFFAQNFSDAFTFLGQPIHVDRLNIILPVGISFYTFQTLSYSIDVYRKNLEPTKDLVAFLAFVSFFPQLVAGPIERATNLLPQFFKERKFEYSTAVDGMRQILWGLFKKIVIADNCATRVNVIFENFQEHSGSTLLLGVIFFAFQIYGDFSGYSDIAIGTARLFGFRLMRNFAFPYFSRDIAEFWRRWHISLSTWFRDYVYIPLGGSHGGKSRAAVNTIIVFVVSGFWHGANWTFIIWGALNALYFIPLLLSNRHRTHLDSPAQGRLLPSIKEAIQITSTFILTLIAWVFFRSTSVSNAFDYLSAMFSPSLFQIPKRMPTDLLVYLFIFVAVEWLGRHLQHPLQLVEHFRSSFIRRGIYYIIILFILLFGGTQQEFIYFQF